MATAIAPSALYRAGKPCAECSGTIADNGLPVSMRARRLCDRCRDLHRIQTYLNQARIIAERLSYDSSLAARIRLAVKAAQR